MRANTFLQQLVVQVLFLCLLLAGMWLIGRSEGKQPASKPDEVEAPDPGRPRARGRMSRGAGARRARTQAAVAVVVAPVSRRAIEEFLLSTCTLEPRLQVQVLARIAEKVVSLEVEEGQEVKAGQALAQLEDRERSLKEKEARVRMTNLKATLDRVAGMFRDNIVSQEQYDDAKVGYETAAVQHESAMLYMDYTTVKSPIDGVVVERLVDVGQHVKTNEVLFTIANYDPIWGRIHVPERYLGKLRPGLPVKVKVESVAAEQIMGKVSMISPVVDATSGTVKVTFEISDPTKYGLRPGMFASTYLITDTHQNARVLPKKALVVESDIDEVFVVKDFLAVHVPKEYASMLSAGGTVTVVAHAAQEPASEAETPAQRPGGSGPPPGKPAASAKPSRGQPVVLQSTFHSVPKANDDEQIECLVALPDTHGLPESMEVELKVAVDAATVTAAAAGGHTRRVTVPTSSAQIRQLALKRPVKLGFSEGNHVEILDGVEEGERVVTVGNEDLKQGAIVAITGIEGAGGVQVVKVKPKPEPRPGARGGGGGDWMARMRERVLANPKVKAEYDKRLAKDPELATDSGKFREFMSDMREQGLIQRRSRRSRGGGGPR